MMRHSVGLIFYGQLPANLSDIACELPWSHSHAIAQELGSSTGVVTHYFRDKEELTLFALGKVFENTLEMMRSRSGSSGASHGEGRQGIERLEQMIFAGLPLETEVLPKL
jgi:AcrR family transcriptional regulator